MAKPTALERAGRVRIVNRVRPLMLHTPWYMFDSNERLAADCGVWTSTIWRLVQHKSNPSYALAEAITKAIERRMGVKITMREIFSTDGTYPTPCVCDLTPNCGGCIDPAFYDETQDELLPAHRNAVPGEWCTYPGINE